MKNKIRELLRGYQESEGIRIQYACESGSRAWGFPSPDSDYDVRFIYSPPLQWYLQVDEQKDVIDAMLPDDVDVQGWELRKALRLFARCNIPLYEWLGSPEVYAGNPELHATLNKLIPHYFRPVHGYFHYLSSAKKGREHLDSEGNIKIKKLFYIIRPLLACEWIVQTASMPPTDMTQVIAGIPEVVSSIEPILQELIAQKSDMVEGEPLCVHRDLLDWIHRAFQRLDESKPHGGPALNDVWGPLNEVMYTYTDRSLNQDWLASDEGPA